MILFRIRLASASAGGPCYAALASGRLVFNPAAGSNGDVIRHARPVPTMPDLPSWVIDILRQSPMVALAIIVFFLADKRVRDKEIRLEERYDKSVADVAAREDKFRSEARQDRDAEIKRFQDAQKALNESNEKRLAEKDEQIASWTKEVAKLSKRVDELLKDLGGK
jgi:hypothetical protein